MIKILDLIDLVDRDQLITNTKTEKKEGLVWSKTFAPKVALV